jgi:predicted Zn-dependent protease
MALELASESTFRRIADTILAAAEAEHTLIRFTDAESTTLRFANNQVVQHVSERGSDVNIRVSFGQKAGRASTNRLDGKSLLSTLRLAEQIARLAPEDPEYLPPLPPQKYLRIPTYRGSTASASPTELAHRTQPVVESCEKNNLVGAGILTYGVAASGIAASTGLYGYEQSTDSEFSLTATGADSSGWTFNSHRNIDALDVDRRTRTAVDKAVRSREPRELSPGHYPVILEPAAVAGVLGPMFWGLNAKSYYRGDSPFEGKLGSLILDTRLTVRTDPTHPDLMGSRFAGEGLASRKMVWVENGVLKQLYYDRFTAKEHGVEPTPFPSAPILTFAGPTVRSTDDLIAQTKRAILVTNFWYIRMVDRNDLTITGMTRDGTFLVEDGKIVCGIKNFRFHDSPLRCFQQVDAATGPQESITHERGKMLLPAVRLPDFHFSSATRF